MRKGAGVKVASSNPLKTPYDRIKSSPAPLINIQQCVYGYRALPIKAMLFCLYCEQNHNCIRGII